MRWTFDGRPYILPSWLTSSTRRAGMTRFHSATSGKMSSSAVSLLSRASDRLISTHCMVSAPTFAWKASGGSRCNMRVRNVLRAMPDRPVAALMMTSRG